MAQVKPPVYTETILVRLHASDKKELIRIAEANGTKPAVAARTMIEIAISAYRSGEINALKGHIKRSKPRE